jgi:hypothetical protein
VRPIFLTVLNSCGWYQCISPRQDKWTVIQRATMPMMASDDQVRLRHDAQSSFGRNIYNNVSLGDESYRYGLLAYKDYSDVPIAFTLIP